MCFLMLHGRVHFPGSENKQTNKRTTTTKCICSNSHYTDGNRDLGKEREEICPVSFISDQQDHGQHVILPDSRALSLELSLGSHLAYWIRNRTCCWPPGAVVPCTRTLHQGGKVNRVVSNLPPFTKPHPGLGLSLLHFLIVTRVLCGLASSITEYGCQGPPASWFRPFLKSSPNSGCHPLLYGGEHRLESFRWSQSVELCS